MVFRYTVTEEEYKESARALLNKKSRIPKLLFSTVIQMGMVTALNLMTDATPWMKWALAGLSLIWAVLSLLQNGLLGLRSKWMLNMLKKNDKTGEFWKEHQLSLIGDELRLRYGKVSNALPCREITSFEKTENMLLIRHENLIFDIVPKAVTETEEWTAFLQEVDEKSHTHVTQAHKEYHEKAEHRVYCRMTREEMADRLMDLKRRSYFNGMAWNRRTLISTGVPILLGVYSAYVGQWVYLGVCVLLLVLFNFSHILVFLPAYRKVLLDSVDDPTEEGYEFILFEKVLYFFSKRRGMSFELSKLKKTEKKDGFTYLYFDKEAMVFVPDALGRYIGVSGRSGSLGEKAKMPVYLNEARSDEPEEEAEEEKAEEKRETDEV